MDFFELQVQARRRTVHLFLLYLLTLILVVLLFFVVAVLVTEGFRLLLPRPESPRLPAWRDLHLLGWMATYVGLIVGGGTLYRWLDLRQGGCALARLFYARRIDPGSAHRHERQLVNVVEEMSIAAGIPVPEIFVLDRQRSINAMAAGYSIDDAAILLTRGALDHLNRDELQGVVAHEFSHILNGDMRLNLRLVSLLNGLVTIHLAGATLLQFVYDDEEAIGINLARGLASAVFGLAVLFLAFALQAIGYIGAVAARLIQAGISRQREFLADAAAVQFTRNPAGIAGALVKIGGHARGGVVRSPLAQEASHMFIVEAVRYTHSLFDSHPPLVGRILRIDRSFDGNFPPLAETTPATPSAPPEPREEAARGSLRERWSPPAMTGLAGVAALEASQLDRARRIARGIPPSLLDGVHHPIAAQAILFLLLSWERIAALDGLEQAGADVQRAFDRFLPVARELSPEALLPLAEMLLPALRQLSPEQHNGLRRQMEEAIDEGELSLSGICLRQFVLHHLDRHFAVKPERDRGTIHALEDAATCVAAVLGAVARAGTKDPEQAWEVAMSALPPSMRQAPLPPLEQCGARELAHALKILPHLSPRLKKTLLEAALFCAGSDQKLDTPEAEMLHLLAAALGLPTPAILGLAVPAAPSGTATEQIAR